MMRSPNNESDLINNYKAFTMNGPNMSPTIHEGDLLVIDMDQKFIISGDIYIVEYKQSTVVCRLLLDRETVTFIFDNSQHSFEEPLYNIKILGRVIEIKTLTD
ncbi:MAG: hypothetical protein COB23_03805 [Methylophaga sp.]|nr:MAG: hypothetical protein COB23_03805 [Methylophaga sp.]